MRIQRTVVALAGALLLTLGSSAAASAAEHKPLAAERGPVVGEILNWFDDPLHHFIESVTDPTQLIRNLTHIPVVGNLVGSYDRPLR
ncbi:hypothetical protein ACWCYL_31930 [Streptomyces sp. 900105755]|uniref:hypothetical protein n=1 Tax=Streptomyces sp. 900105755 TaxID=3154389 RepID=UPI0033316279